jgi:nitroreductase
MTSADDLYDILSTTRSIRRISNKPVDDAVLERILQAAVWAPSGGNRQPWRIVVVRDRALKQQLSDIYSVEWANYVDINMKRVAEMPADVIEQVRAGLAVGTHLAENLADVPVVAMFVFDPREVFVTDNNLNRVSVVGGASLYPAVQNLLLAARAEGLGGVLTTLISTNEPAVNALLNIPAPWGVYAMVPLGYPVGNHGPLRRAPLDTMVMYDQWPKTS